MPNEGVRAMWTMYKLLLADHPGKGSSGGKRQNSAYRFLRGAWKDYEGWRRKPEIWDVYTSKLKPFIHRQSGGVVAGSANGSSIVRSIDGIISGASVQSTPSAQTTRSVPGTGLTIDTQDASARSGTAVRDFATSMVQTVDDKQSRRGTYGSM